MLCECDDCFTQSHCIQMGGLCALTLYAMMITLMLVTTLRSCLSCHMQVLLHLVELLCIFRMQAARKLTYLLDGGKFLCRFLPLQLWPCVALYFCVLCYTPHSACCLADSHVICTLVSSCHHDSYKFTSDASTENASRHDMHITGSTHLCRLWVQASASAVYMQYMVGYTFLMATGVNGLFAYNGSSFSVLQVRLPPHAAVWLKQGKHFYEVIRSLILFSVLMWEDASSQKGLTFSVSGFLSSEPETVCCLTAVLVIGIDIVSRILHGVCVRYILLVTIVLPKRLPVHMQPSIVSMPAALLLSLLLLMLRFCPASRPSW